MTYIINGKRFNCVLDAMEYRDILDAHYIKVIWRQYKNEKNPFRGFTNET